MFTFRHGRQRVNLDTISRANAIKRFYSLERTQIKIPNTRNPAAPFPVIESCPAPTCQCREMPAGLDIEREQSLSGTMAAYAEQILISTGKSDWKSRIEDEEGVHGDAVRGLKGLLGPKGKFSVVGQDSRNVGSHGKHRRLIHTNSHITMSFSLPPLFRQQLHHTRSQVRFRALRTCCHHSHIFLTFRPTIQHCWKPW